MNNIVTPQSSLWGKHGVRILKRHADVNEVEPFFSYFTDFLAFIHKCVICGS